MIELNQAQITALYAMRQAFKDRLQVAMTPTGKLAARDPATRRLWEIDRDGRARKARL